MPALCQGLHPALDRALALAGGEAAGRARFSLERVLRDLDLLEPAAWSGSALGRTGFPVEIAFVAGERPPGSFRYTAEVAGPAVPRRNRLDLAATLAAELGGLALDPEIQLRLSAVQDSGTLKYGAWLSGRHGSRGDSYKVYAEVPPESWSLLEPWERRQVGAPPVLPHRRVELSMVGLQAGRTELYYSSLGLRAGEVATALSRVGWEARAPEVLALLQESYGRTIRCELPCRDFGWSYALGPGGEVEAFTLYTFANSLLGGDGRIRAALLRLARAHGWEIPLYEAMSRPLAERRGPLTHHGMFGIVVPASGPLTLSFGLVPPEVEA
jgi:hypothetical protein